MGQSRKLMSSLSSRGASPLFSISEKDISNLENKVLEVFTDGCCLRNPGDGGFAVLFITDEKLFVYKKKIYKTTSNILELSAVLFAANVLKNENIKIYTDSKYVADGYNKYLNNWVKKNWKNNQNKIVANLDLWKNLYITMKEKKNLKIEWIQGHAGLVYNEMVDVLAKEAAGYVKP